MKPGNKPGKRHFTADYKDVIMTDDKYVKPMGHDMSQEGRSKGTAVTDYAKTKEGKTNG